MSGITGDATASQRIRQLEESVQLLSNELAETNQGVVALYSELEDKARQLAEVSELKSRFLSYMSHEFKTPLSSILSIVNILVREMDGPLTEEQRVQVGFVQASAVELTDIVNDLLDLAKIEAGRITVSPGWFELVDLFSALRGMFRPLLSSTNLNLTFDEPDGVVSLYTDHKKLAQILRNFISNAIKFTEEGEIRVSAQADGECVVFSVKDSGIGISAENIDSLFQDFSQIATPIHNRFKGTGLGLALSKKIAQVLGGTVGVESTVGVGSLFYVRIPKRFDENLSADASSS